MQICRRCFVTKELDSFCINTTYKNNRATICKVCSAEEAKQRREANPYKHKAKKFKITEDHVKELLSRTVCDICGQPEKQKDPRTKEVRSLAIDHNHLTGKVRGVLCSDCNTGLGKFKDELSLLEKAIDYLKETNDSGNQR